MKQALFDQNNFTGEIPAELMRMGVGIDGVQTMVVLNVTGNEFLEGTIPEGLCRLGDAFLFDCSSQLCGCSCETVCNKN